jgi:hypothetical protein
MTDLGMEENEPDAPARIPRRRVGLMCSGVALASPEGGLRGMHRYDSCSGLDAFAGTLAGTVDR